jgi:predicted amidohydrolase YtcJ
VHRNSRFTFLSLLTVFVFMGLVACSWPSTPATLTIINARIWTGNPAQPWAGAIAVHDDSILAVSANTDIESYITDQTRIIDGSGAMVTPGFIDTHVHFFTGGFRLAAVQLRDARTPDEFIAHIAALAKSIEPGAWITGGDCDHEQWGGELPRRGDWIDSVTVDNPVWLNRLDGHMAWANTAALEVSDVTRRTPGISGGTIVRRRSGGLPGIFKDNAIGLFDYAIPDSTVLMKDRALDAAMEYVAAQGVTSVHHMGGRGNVAVFDCARKAGRLKTRIYAATPLSSWEGLRDKIAHDGRGDTWLNIGGLRGFVDGSLGSHIAAFFDPFTDALNDKGLLVNTEEKRCRWTAGADKAGLQKMVHAIGDRAINIQLDLYERVAWENGVRDRRFRIEHAQHIASDDMARFAALNDIPRMQPNHAIDDGRWAEKVIGSERIKTTYAFRSLHDAGAKLGLDSDCFVAPPIPLEGIYAAVTRRTLDDQNPEGWVPEQKISVEEALQRYSVNAAYASFEEDVNGTLEPGMLADLVIIDQDLAAIPLEKIRDAKVILTVLGGKVLYEE